MPITYNEYKPSPKVEKVLGEILKLAKKSKTLDVMGEYVDLSVALQFFDEGNKDGADSIRYKLRILQAKNEPIDGLTEMIGELIEHPLGVPGRGLLYRLGGEWWQLSAADC